MAVSGEVPQESAVPGYPLRNPVEQDLGAMLSNPDFVSGLKLLAQAGMVLETANQTPGLIDATLRTADKVPGCASSSTLPQMEPPSDSAARSAYESNLRELAKRPQVWLKVSEVIRRVNGEVPTDPNSISAADELYGIFGETMCCSAAISEQRPVGDL